MEPNSNLSNSQKFKIQKSKKGSIGVVEFLRKKKGELSAVCSYFFRPCEVN